MRGSLLTLGLVLTAAGASACCGVGTGPATFAGQRNIIVWDEKNRVEHFIRDASFNAKGKDFGFIAPTPTKPTLHEVDRKAFDFLNRLFQTKSAPPTDRAGVGAAASVSVVEVKTVAGYKATVLTANDAKALTAWLKQNGYPVTAGTTKWAEPYVKKGWYLTAFKVNNGKNGAATGPVRMTFKTDQPFNPYRVPAENKPKSGSGLTLHFVSARQYTGTVGGKTPWIGGFHRVLSEPEAKRLTDLLRLGANGVPSNAFVTMYTDPSFPNPGAEDLFFIPAAGKPRIGAAKF